MLGSFQGSVKDDISGSPLGLFVDDAALQQLRQMQQQSALLKQKSARLMSEWADSNNQSGAAPLIILQQIAENEATNFTSAELNERYKTLMASNIDWRVEYIAHFYVMPVLLVIGFINQSLNLLTLSTLPPVGYAYLKASAWADVLSIFAIIPFCLRHGNAHNPYSQWAMFFHAHIELPLANSLITASALCLVAMTIDRYLSIRHPIAFFNSPDSKSRIRTNLIIIFLISFAVFFPSCWQRVLVPIIENNRTKWRIERNYGLNHSNLFKIYVMLREIIARIGPIVVLVALNIEMIRTLKRISKKHHSRRVAQTEVARIRDQDRARISVLLLISTATFVICTLPASLLSLFIDNTSDGFGMQVFRSFANCLQVSHYLHNFYLYTLLSSEYRNAFLILIGCRTHRSPGQTTGDYPTNKISNNVLGRVHSLRMVVIGNKGVNAKQSTQTLNFSYAKVPAL
ncbi:7 transmembrane receptor (rhodopsin family) domain-containing protein [Ditylenchus destructor]|nr:7 transmembrane receptor (rhodopsin family) domain-containing protein [Ditylenchus destructor]